MAEFTPEERASLQEAADALLEARSGSQAVRAVVASGAGLDRDLWRQMGELGWTALLVPEAYGGLDLGLSPAVVVLQALGAHTTPAPYLSSAVLATWALRSARSQAPKERWLPALASGDAIGAVALTAPGGRVDPRSFGVRAHRSDERGWELRGSAGFVLDGSLSDLIVVGVSDASNGQSLLFALEREAPGVRAREVPGIDLTRTLAHLDFEGVVVGPDDLLAEGREAEDLVDDLIDIGAVALAADGLGAAKRALDMSVEYAKQRVQFGRVIGEFQAIKHKLADMFVLVTSSEAAVAGAARTLDVDPAVARRRAACAGSFCRAAASRVTGDAVQTHGGIGFTWEHDCHLLLKRAKFDEIYLSDLWSQRERLVETICPRAPRAAQAALRA